MPKRTDERDWQYWCELLFSVSEELRDANIKSLTQVARDARERYNIIRQQFMAWKARQDDTQTKIR